MNGGGIVNGTNIYHVMILGMFALIILYSTNCLYNFEGTTDDTRLLISMGIDLFSMVTCGLVYVTILMDPNKGNGMEIMLCILSVEVILLLCDIIQGLSKGDPGMNTEHDLAYMGIYFFSIVLTALFWKHQAETMIEQQKRKNIGYILCPVILLVSLAFILTNPYTELIYDIDDDGDYEDGVLAMVFNFLPLIFLILSAMVTLHMSRNFREKMAALTYLAIPIAAIIIQNLFDGLSLIYSSLTLIILVVYGNFHLTRGEELEKKKLELENQRITSMISQIQPHFLYNALTSIMNIEGNPPATKEAIADFGYYLRDNLNTISCVNPIPFSKEIEHVENYVTLEKLRFKKKLEVVWHISDRRFAIPALTLQMMVENAIKHGVTQKLEGGTIHIVSERVEEGHLVKIIDNGVGFDTEKPVPQDGRAHVGLQNARSRVEAMVNGTITIKSEIGKGTTVTIFIPD